MSSYGVRTSSLLIVIYCLVMVYEENEPQIMAPRVTPLESVSTHGAPCVCAESRTHRVSALMNADL